MPHVIAVLNQKGGVGKTTLATNLARAYQLEGRRVLLADADPQASSVEWSESYAGEEEMPAVVGVDKDRFEPDVKAVLPAFDVVVIDGPPRMDARSKSAIKAADLVLIPVQPSALDIRATAPLLSLLRAQWDYTPGNPRAAFLVSRQITGTNLAEEAAEALRTFGLPVLEASTAQRIAYAEAAGEGLSVLDYASSSKAAEEIKAIAREALEVLNGEER